MYTVKPLSVEQPLVVKIGRCFPRIPGQFCTLFYNPAFKSWRRSSDRAIYACSNGSTQVRTCNGTCPSLGSTPEMKE